MQEAGTELREEWLRELKGQTRESLERARAELQRLERLVWAEKLGRMLAVTGSHAPSLGGAAGGALRSR